MLILAAVLAIFVYGMIAAMLGTILPGLSERFHLTPNQNGRIAFAQAIGLAIASVGVGPLIDNEGKKIGLVLGLALIAIALAWLPKSGGFGSIAALMFMLGVGGGVVVTGANALVSDVGELHRGTALNLVNLFFGLGGMATPFISANLLKRNTVKLCYTAGVFALVALAVQLAAPIPGPSGVQSFVLADAGTVLGKPILLMLGLLLFLYVSCEVGIWNWLAQHLIAQGIPESRALNVLSLGFALGMLLGRVAVSPILITVAPERVTMASAILMALFAREKSGRGDFIDIAMYDSLLAWTPNVTAPVFAEDRAPVPAEMRPYGGQAMNRLYETRDGGHIVLGGSEVKFAENLLRALGRLDLLDIAKREPGEQQALIDFFVATFAAKTRGEWEAFLGPLDLCWAPLRNLKDAFDDPHTEEREMVLTDEAGKRHIGPAVKFAHDPAEADLRLPQANDADLQWKPRGLTRSARRDRRARPSSR